MSTSKEGYVKVIPKENSSQFQSWEPPNVSFIAQEEVEESQSLPMITAEKLEKIHQNAYDEGFEEGKLRGIKEGFEQGEEEGKQQGHKQAYDDSLKDIEEKLFHFEKLFSALKKPLSQTNEQVEYELMQLSFFIAKHILKQEIHALPEQIINLVHQSLDLLPSASKDISVYLHPLDVVMVKGAFNLLPKDVDNKANNEKQHQQQQRFDKLKIIENINITRGGCIVNTDISHIDASIEQRIEELSLKLLPEAPKLNTDTHILKKDMDDSVEANDSLGHEDTKPVEDSKPESKAQQAEQ